MAFVFTESRIMPKQAIASASSTKGVPIGTIVRALNRHNASLAELENAARKMKHDMGQVEALLHR